MAVSGSELRAGAVAHVDLGVPAGHEAGFARPVVVVTAQEILEQPKRAVILRRDRVASDQLRRQRDGIGFGILASGHGLFPGSLHLWLHRSCGERSGERPHGYRFSRRTQSLSPLGLGSGRALARGRSDPFQGLRMRTCRDTAQFLSECLPHPLLVNPHLRLRQHKRSE